MQLLTLVITLLAIFGAMYGNRKSTEDMRDVLRAELKAGRAESTLELRKAVAPLHLALQRIENKLDHLAEVQARHSEKLENRG
jgi:hypothetical protein